MRLFQQDSYISMDFLNKQSEVIKIEDNIKNDTNDNVFSFPIQLNNDNLKYVVVKKSIYQK